MFALSSVIFPEVIVVLLNDQPPTLPPVFAAELAAVAAAEAVVFVFATVSSVKPLSLFKSDIFLPEILILAAETVPVVILPPSIVVEPLAPTSAACSGETVVLPSEKVLPLVKVISPLNPIPCCEAWKVRLLPPEAVPPPAVFSSALKYEYQYLFELPAANVGGVVAHPLVKFVKVLFVRL